jgi:hypothetical protein
MMDRMLGLIGKVGEQEAGRVKQEVLDLHLARSAPAEIYYLLFLPFLLLLFQVAHQQFGD